MSALACRAMGVRATAQPGPGVTRVSAPMDSAVAIRAANARTVEAVLKGIAGHETEPAGEVFKNVDYLKNVPARRFLGIMSGGYADALGVRCTHCHTLGDFSSDEKRPKRAAREMQVMHRSVNLQLKQMQNLETQPPEERTINCWVCHRGSVNPNTGGP